MSTSTSSSSCLRAERYAWEGGEVAGLGWARGERKGEWGGGEGRRRGEGEGRRGGQLKACPGAVLTAGREVCVAERKSHDMHEF